MICPRRIPLVEPFWTDMFAGLDRSLLVDWRCSLLDEYCWSLCGNVCVASANSEDRTNSRNEENWIWKRETKQRSDSNDMSWLINHKLADGRERTKEGEKKKSYDADDKTAMTGKCACASLTMQFRAEHRATSTRKTRLYCLSRTTTNFDTSERFVCPAWISSEMTEKRPRLDRIDQHMITFWVTDTQENTQRMRWASWSLRTLSLSYFGINARVFTSGIAFFYLLQTVTFLYSWATVGVCP